MNEVKKKIGSDAFITWVMKAINGMRIISLICLMLEYVSGVSQLRARVIYRSAV